MYEIEMINNLFQRVPLVEGGLMLMLAGWLGYQARELPLRLLELLRGWTTRVVQIRETSPLFEAWLALLTESAVRRGGPRTLEVRACRNDRGDEGVNARFAAGTDAFWARFCDRWCRVCVFREQGTADANDLSRKLLIHMEVVLGTAGDLERMMRAAKARADAGTERQWVDICNKYGSRTRLALPRRAMETLCLPREFFAPIESRVREFLDGRKDYERAGIPWRFGVLLHGAPGTGKTSIAHVLASTLQRRLAVIPLADLRSDEDMVSAFDAVVDPSIVLIEDVDCAFIKRNNEDAEGITFSGFLNCIDGMLAPHNGRILIMTTNHVDRLDPALIRPGRIDLRVEVPRLTRDAAIDYVDRVFPHMPTRHEIVDRIMREPAPTPAALINHLMTAGWRRSVAVGLQPTGRNRRRCPAPGGLPGGARNAEGVCDSRSR